VVVAVRIAGAAAPGEVLVSGVTRDLAASAGDLSFDKGRDITLKGFAEPRRVHSVCWD
jgi:class 3 adenylate cyclase